MYKKRVVEIERGFLSSGGRGVKQKKNVGKHVVISSSMSNDDTVSGNKEDTSSIAAKINDIERQMLEASTMDPFSCLSNTFGTPNTNTKVDIAGTSGTSANNGEDGLVNMIKSDKLNSMEDLKSVPVWVKLHDVCVTALMEDGSSAISKLGTPLILVQTTTAKKMDNRQAKQKDTNSNKVSSNYNSSSKSMVDVASSSGTKIVTSNLFDVLNMVEKDIGVARSNFLNSKSDDVNLGNSKNVNLDNEDNDSDDDEEEEENETSRFLASKF
ncbi:hypothetical protein Tco_0774152 [Tanacetum coccineum]|uniref:DUF4283 domain-containing protein n=1 Tax=Tanacetum coccineum TaxID=301880 RepID=A0ABQ4ZQA2_9ASTR